MSIPSILKAIACAESIIILSHVQPDGDAYGSTFGLARLIRKNHPGKPLFAATKGRPPANFATGIAQPADSDFGRSLVIVVDTSTGPRIADQRWKQGNLVVKIDHHPAQESYGQLEWVDTTYPSCCEMVYALALAGGWKLNRQAATCLFHGIATDTGRFLFDSVGPDSFKRAADLLGYGVPLSRVYRSIYSRKEAILRFRGYLLSNFKAERGMAYIFVTKETLLEYGLGSYQAADQVGLLGDLEGVLIWATFCEEADGSAIQVALRSREVGINQVAFSYGGGGHRLAAGTSVPDWDTAGRLLEDLRAVLRPAP